MGFQPGNKLGRGRPRGSRNKVTTLTQELLNDHAPSITRKCIALAPKRTHLSDALGYMIEKEFPMKPKAGERPGVIV